MKPVYLRMKAFGSYRNELIDFRNVDHGIFLITGDTGAGKTTIFDAITFALYGESSGGKRDGRMMVSQYAPPGEYTEVEFCFLYGNDRYVIKRSPEQPRYREKENADGTRSLEELKTLRAPEVELTMPDGSIFSGRMRETNEKIREIIGIDDVQFTQIAMLAQGDFLKLLHARSDERRDIFAKIFDTCFYEAVEREIEDRFKALAGALEDNRKEIETWLGSVVCAAEGKLRQEWAERGAFSDDRAEEILRLTEEIIAEFGLLRRQKQAEIEARTVRAGEIEKKLNDAAAANRDFDDLDQAEQVREALGLQRPEMEGKRAGISGGERAIKISGAYGLYLGKKKDLMKKDEAIGSLKVREGAKEALRGELEERKRAADERYAAEHQSLIGEAAQLEGKLALYDEIACQRERYGREAKRLEERSAEREMAAGEKKAAEERIDSVKARLEGLAETAGRRDSIGRELDRLFREQEDLKAVLKLWKTWERQEKELKLCRGSFEAAEAARLAAETEYNRLYEEFIGGQARVLRALLAEGERCPVCGSVYHGAGREEETVPVTQEAVETAKRANDAAADRAQQARQALQRITVQREETGKQLDLYRERSEFPEAVASAEEAGKRLRGVTGEIGRLKGELSEAEEASKALEAGRTELKDIQNVFEKAGADLQKLDEEIAGLRSSAEEKKRALDEKAAKLPFPTRKEAEEKLSGLRAEGERLETEKKEAGDRYQQVCSELTAVRAELETESRSRSVLAGEEEQCRKDFAEGLLKNGFASEEEFLRASLSDGELEALKHAVSEYDGRVRENQASLRILEDRTRGKQRVDVSGFLEEKRKLAEELERLQEDDREIFAGKQADEKAGRNIAAKYEERGKLRREYSVLKALNDTAGGKISRRRIDFQTYIQRRYFGQVIRAANERLVRMSGGQFLLRCKELERLETNRNVGLDLDVYSIVNDQTRDVKTLSGGESFMAALSMALGLSDLIQRRAGKIRIDTMFIDEGFGSLSDETRNQALSLLSELSEGSRLIGIISHVSELKAQVDTKLAVTKTDAGSRARWIK